jgi:hypothetical protein
MPVGVAPTASMSVSTCSAGIARLAGSAGRVPLVIGTAGVLPRPISPSAVRTIGRSSARRARWAAVASGTADGPNETVGNRTRVAMAAATAGTTTERPNSKR